MASKITKVMSCYIIILSIYFLTAKKIPQHQKKRRVCKDERNEKKNYINKNNLTDYCNK
jgi:uncharacterized protein YdaU (DUF1376 family)